jgi:hypothetical protein
VGLEDELLGLLPKVKSKTDDYSEILNLILEDIQDLADEHETQKKKCMTLFRTRINYGFFCFFSNFENKPGYMRI